MTLADRKIKISSKKAFVTKAIWNEQLSVGFFALALFICTILLIWEDVVFRQDRKLYLEKIKQLEFSEQQKTHSSVQRSTTEDYHSSVKAASSYLRQYQRNPENSNNLNLALAQLKLALKQVGSDPTNEPARLKIQQKLDEILKEVKSKGLEFQETP